MRYPGDYCHEKQILADCPVCEDRFTCPDSGYYLGDDEVL